MVSVLCKFKKLSTIAKKNMDVKKIERIKLKCNSKFAVQILRKELHDNYRTVSTGTPVGRWRQNRPKRTFTRTAEERKG